jgi:RNA recognition motif-containing protein
MKNKATGRPRGFGFVTFDNMDSVEAVMEAAGQHEIDGKSVEVKRCVPRENGGHPQQMFDYPPPAAYYPPPGPYQRHPAYYPQPVPAYYPQPHPGAFVSGRPQAYRPPPVQYQPARHSQPPPVAQQSSTKIFIGGIGECNEDCFTDYFSEFGSIIDVVVMRDRATRKSRGFGFVTFDQPEAVDAVMAFGHEPGVDGSQLDSSSFHVINEKNAEIKRADGAKPGLAVGGAAPPPRYQEVVYQEIEPERPRGRPDRGQESRNNKVFVGGLGDATDDELIAYFQQFGNIIDHIVMKDKGTGRTRGFGFVTYDNPDSVDEVMSLYTDHNLNGKWIEVKRTVPEEQMGSKSGGKGKGSRGGRASPY